MKDRGQNYAVYADSDARPFFQGNDIRSLVSQLNAQLQPGSISTVYLELEGFPEHKAVAFETSCRIQQEQVSKNRAIAGLVSSEQSSVLRNGYFSKARLDPTFSSQLTEVPSGPFRGFV